METRGGTTKKETHLGIPHSLLKRGGKKSLWAARARGKCVLNGGKIKKYLGERGYWDSPEPVGQPKEPNPVRTSDHGKGSRGQEGSKRSRGKRKFYSKRKGRGLRRQVASWVKRTENRGRAQAQ